MHLNINSICNDVMNDNSTGSVDQQVGVDVDCKIADGTSFIAER